MKLVSENELKQYFNSGLYQMLRSYQDESSDFTPFILTHYLPTKKDPAEEQAAVEKLQQQDKVSTPTEEKKQAPETDVKPAPARRSAPKPLVGNIQEPQTEIARPRPKNYSSQIDNVGTKKERPKQDSPQTNSISVTKPEQSVNNKAPEKENTTSFTETISVQKPTNKQDIKRNNQAVIKYDSVDRIEPDPTNGQAKKIFDNLKSAFETTEWLNAANKVKVELHANLQNMPIKSIKCTDLATNVVGYIPINSYSLNKIQSIIIIKDLMGIMIIFNDGTNLNIAPASILQQPGVNAQYLIKHKYTHVYSALNLEQFIEGLKPLCAAEMTAPQYIQMWMKYIPFIPLNEK